MLTRHLRKQMLLLIVVFCVTLQLSANETQPENVTNLLTNADLSKSETGWGVWVHNVGTFTTKWTFDTTTSTVTFEAYAGYANLEKDAFGITQKVSLTAGMYRLKTYAFFRYGKTYCTDILADGKKRSTAYLIAGKDSVPLMRLGEYEKTSYANTMSEAAAEFAKGYYENSLVFKVESTQTVELGIRGTFSEIKSWMITGPFTLERITQDVLDAENIAEQKADLLTLLDKYDAIANQALDHSAYDTTIESIRTGLTSLTTLAEVEDAIKKTHEAFATLLSTQTTSTGQFDLTSLIQNPTMDKNFDGWTNSNGLPYQEGGTPEAFDKTAFSFSQVLKDMPAGSYTLKVQAFSRPRSYKRSITDYMNGTEKVLANLFFGSASTPLKDIHDCARNLSARPSSDVDGAYNKSIPNTLNGAADAFALGMYWNVLYVENQKAGDITMGIKQSGGLGANWVSFDNFRLYYGPKVVDVTLQEGKAMTIDDDTYANVTTDIALKAGQLNSLCVPFDVPTSEFTEIYTLAGINFNSETPVGYLVPAYEVKAGNTYFVKVAEDKELKVDNVLLNVAAPDSVPVIWDYAATTGQYKTQILRKTYILSDEGNLTYKLAVRSCNYRSVVNVPTSYINAKTKSIPLQIVNLDSVNFEYNIENVQARQFLANANYPVAASASVVSTYNVSPPARRDQPKTAMIPIPGNSSSMTIKYADNEALSSASSIQVAAGTTLAEIPNLVPGKTYYYKVYASNKVLTQGQFTTTGSIRMIKADSGANIRDFGGRTVSSGKTTKYELLYRGGEMNGGHEITEADRQELLKVGIGAELDLRSDVDLASYSITHSALGKDIPYKYMNQVNFVEDAYQTDTANIRTSFHFIVENLRARRPVIFHCVWGADRTGAWGLLLGGLLGFTTDQLYKDYELTSFSIAGLREKTGIDTKLTYIKTFTGNNLQEQFYNYMNQYARIPSEELDDFIAIMFGEYKYSEQADVNEDGSVDSQDVLKVYEYMKTSTADPTSTTLEDVNGDSAVDSQDVLKIYEYMKNH